MPTLPKLLLIIFEECRRIFPFTVPPDVKAIISYLCVLPYLYCIKPPLLKKQNNSIVDFISATGQSVNKEWRMNCALCKVAPYLPETSTTTKPKGGETTEGWSLWPSWKGINFSAVFCSLSVICLFSHDPASPCIPDSRCLQSCLRTLRFAHEWVTGCSKTTYWNSWPDVTPLSTKGYSAPNGSPEPQLFRSAEEPFASSRNLAGGLAFCSWAHALHV